MGWAALGIRVSHSTGQMMYLYLSESKYEASLESALCSDHYYRFSREGLMGMSSTLCAIDSVLGTGLLESESCSTLLQQTTQVNTNAAVELNY